MSIYNYKDKIQKTWLMKKTTLFLFCMIKDLMFWEQKPAIEFSWKAYTTALWNLKQHKWIWIVLAVESNIFVQVVWTFSKVERNGIQVDGEMAYSRIRKDSEISLMPFLEQ